MSTPATIVDASARAKEALANMIEARVHAHACRAQLEAAQQNVITAEQAYNKAMTAMSEAIDRS